VTRSLHLLALGAGMCLLAGAFAVPSLYVPGVALLLLPAAAAAAVAAAARGCTVELEVPAESIVEGEQLLATASVRGATGMLCRGTLRAGSGGHETSVGARRRSLEVAVRPARRGRATIGPPAVRFADPFQICARERTGATRQLIVLPRLEHVRREDLERLLRLAPAGGAREPGSGADGLRPYRPGSPASRVHWLSVARTGTLVERRLSPEAEQMPVTVLLDARGAPSAGALDTAVRAATALVAGLARIGGCSVLLPGMRHPEALDESLVLWPRVHEQLALIEDGAPDWQAAREALRLVLVQAHAPVPPAGLPVSCTVAPVADPRRAVLFGLAGCAVQPIAPVAAGRAA
jgi:uncharacterized protein (DUF58 family)